MEDKKRLIDASALGIGKAKREVFDNPAYADGWNSAIAIIENAPTVDAVEVVRCKDCKGWCAEEIAKQYGVDRYCTMTMIPTNADDFCSLGERKDNGKE